MGLGRWLHAAFPDLSTQAAARSVHEAYRAATLMGIDTVEMVERLARELLVVQRRREEALERANNGQTAGIA